MMIRMLLMLSFFLLPSTGTYAGFGGLEDGTEAFSPSLFCEEIQKNLANNSPLEKTCGGFKNHVQETAITALCESFVAEYQNNPTETIQRCEELGVSLKTALNSTGKGDIVDISGLSYDVNKRVKRGTLDVKGELLYDITSPTMKACQDKFKENCFSLPLEAGFSQFLGSFPKDDYFALSENDVTYNNETCECFSKARNLAASLFKEDQRKEDEEGRTKILEIAENNLAKKLINEFAGNLERSHFYKANKNTALSSLGDDPSFSCTNFKDYSEDIQKACDASGLDKNQVKTKISHFLDIFENKKTDAPIKDKLQQLEERILNIGKSRDGKLMDRAMYDNYRYTNALVGPESIFIQEFLRKIMSDKEMYQYMTRELDEKRPAWVLSEMMIKFSGQKMDKFLRDFSRRDDIPNAFKKDLSTAFASEKEMKEFRASTFEIAIDMNPSFKAALGNKELFLEVFSNLDHKNSLMNALEKSSDKMKEHYLERCDQFRKKFAEVICTPKEKYLEKMNRDDMKKIVQENMDKFPSANMIDKIMCDLGKDSGDKSSPFSSVAFTAIDRYIESDYASRMKSKDPQELNDRYSYLSREMNSGNKSVERLIERSSNYSNHSSPFVPSIASLDEKDSPSANSLPQVKSQLPQEQMIAAAAQGHYQNFAVASVERSPASTKEESKGKTKSSKSEENLHDLFKSFFAEESQKRKVDDHLKNISESDYKELQKLQEQIARGRVELNEIANKNQQEKIKALEEKLKRLESEKRPADSPMESLAQRKESSQEKFIGNTPQFQTGGFAPNREAPVPPPTSTGGTSSAAAGPVQSTQGSSANALAKNPSGESKGSESNYSVREVSGGDLIITSSKVHSNNLRSEDLSAEVIDFVKNKKPDLQTLKRLMSKGLILKLKVMKDGTEVQKEFKVDSSKLTQEARSYLQNQINLQEYQETKRQHSFASLKYLLGIKMQSTVN